MQMTRHIFAGCRWGAERPVGVHLPLCLTIGTGGSSAMKRLTCTDKWKKPWFRKLSYKAKLLFLFILDNCDCAGIWDIDLEYASFMTGQELSPAELKEIEKNVVYLSPSKAWVPEFVSFQCGKLNPASPPHRTVISTFQKTTFPPELHGLLEHYQYPKPTLGLEHKNRIEKNTEGGTGGNGAIYSEDFIQFWTAYPRKEAKGQAWSAWKKPGRPELSVLLDAICRQKQSEKWTKEGGQFIPMPSTWLNGKCWEDELRKPVQPRMF